MLYRKENKKLRKQEDVAFLNYSLEGVKQSDVIHECVSVSMVTAQSTHCIQKPRKS